MSLTGNNETVSEAVEVIDDSLLRRNLADDFGQASLCQMKVFLRVRPLNANDSEQRECISVDSAQSVLLTAPEQSATYRNHSMNESKTKQRFSFTRVFGPRDDQKAVFNGSVLGSMKDFVNGQNCLVFAYGTTNSGKTYTVQGNALEPGIIPHAVEVAFKSIGNRLDENLNLKPIGTFSVEELAANPLNEMVNMKKSLLEGVGEFYSSLSTESIDQSASLFDESCRETVVELSIQEKQDFKFRLWVSFAEIYNENIYDLLDNLPEKRHKLRLAVDHSGNNYIKGLKVLPIESPKEARQFLTLGRRNLHIASTKLNQSSSRSHCIFTIYIVRALENTDVPQYMINSLSFCDLAGSERVVKTQNTGTRLKEAGKINNSLMVFGRCIEALRNVQNSRDRPVIPFRDSKLTQLFQLFFIGKGRASMIVNVSPSADMFDDTVNVLRVSAIAKQVISSDNLDKTWLNMSASQRLTDLWTKSGQRWSSFSRGRDIPSKMSIMTVKEDSVIAEEEEVEDEKETEDDQPDVQELINIIIDLEKKYNDLVDENSELEKNKSDLCQSFQKQLMDLGNCYERRIAKMQESAEEYMEKRLQLAEKALLLSIGYKHEEQANGETDDMDENEEELNNVEKVLCEVTSERNSLLEKIQTLQQQLEEAKNRVKELEAEVLRLSGELNDKQRNYDNLVSSMSSELESKILLLSENNQTKDQEIEELRRRLDQTSTANTELRSLRTKLEESDQNIKELTLELSVAQVSLSDEKTQCQHVVSELETKHTKKVSLLEEKIQGLSTKISQAEEYLEQERIHFEKRITDLQGENGKKIKSLEGEVHRLMVKVSDNAEAAVSQQKRQLESQASSGLSKKNKSLEDELSKTKQVLLVERSRADSLQASLKKAENQRERAVEDFEKMGDILLEKDSEIEALSVKVQLLQEKAVTGQNLGLDVERLRQGNMTEMQKMMDLVQNKDSEIGLLKAQIATLEKINTSDDFQAPAPRARRRARRAKENAPPTSDLSDVSTLSSQADESLLSKSSLSSSNSSRDLAKDRDRMISPSLGMIDYIKQSPPVLAARNVLSSFRDTLKRNAPAETVNAVSQTPRNGRKMRRKMYEKTAYSPLECTPPKQSADTTQSVHSIVARQLRSRK